VKLTTPKIFFGLLIALLLGTYLWHRLNAPSLAPEYLAGEIRAYGGERLGTLADFPENSIRGPQKVDLETYRLEIGGLVRRSRALRYHEVLDLPRQRKVLTLPCVDGWEVRVLWEGVRLRDLLEPAGVLPEARSVVFYGLDGNSTALPLDYLRQKDVLLAYRLNGVPLPDVRGFPFQLAAESKLGYKWIRWVSRLEVSASTNYLGHWEVRGYSNSADAE